MYSPNNIIRTFSVAVCAFFYLAAMNVRALTLGTFQFNDSQFGDALLESDGGTWRSGNWLNIVPSDPGNPAALTGPSVDTGIANIGLGERPIYTIFYNTPNHQRVRHGSWNHQCSIQQRQL